MGLSIWWIILIVVVVAVVASLVTVKMTGGAITGDVIKVAKTSFGTDVYTKAEIDKWAIDLKNAIDNEDKRINCLQHGQQYLTFSKAGLASTIILGGASHNISFISATNPTTAIIVVDGIQKTMTEGSSAVFTGDLYVYVNDVTYQTYAGGVKSVSLAVSKSC